MYKDLQKKLSLLREPTAFKIKTFDELLIENIDLAKEVLGEDWKPLESDPYMKKIRVLTLRQVYNQVDKKETFKQLLITTATGVDLDLLGANFEVFRDWGEYPYTDFEFKLLVISEKETVIPAGTVLGNDDDEYKSKLIKKLIIPAGELSAIGKVELEHYVVESNVETENIISELTFALDVKQLGVFSNGAITEDDDRYRLRIIASNAKYSTAGSVEAYKYFAYSSDARIDDVSIPQDNKALDVDIYLASFEEVDELMINNVYKTCSAKYTRPLNDNLTVRPAEIVSLDLLADIEVFDLLLQNELDTNIRENFKDTFFIGQNFVKSDFIRKCHINNVYRVNTNFEDVVVNDKQVIRINSLKLEFKEAQI